MGRLLDSGPPNHGKHAGQPPHRLRYARTGIGDEEARVSDWASDIKDKAREALPPLEGELKVSGLKEPVEVIRDRWGVPHIYGQNLHDVLFAQGFVVASERLFQLDFMLRLANGRLSELVSEMALPMDRFFRMLGFNRAAARIAAGYDEEDIAVVSALEKGIRAWLDHMPVKPIEYQVLDIEPNLPLDDTYAYATAGQ